MTRHAENKKSLAISRQPVDLVVRVPVIVPVVTASDPHQVAREAHGHTIAIRAFGGQRSDDIADQIYSALKVCRTSRGSLLRIVLDTEHKLAGPTRWGVVKARAGSHKLNGPQTRLGKTIVKMIMQAHRQIHARVGIGIGT